MGTIVNACSIVLGSVLGLFLKQGIPEKYQVTIMLGLALVIAVIGLQMAMKSQNMLIVIASIALGALVGELMELDVLLNRLGNYLASAVKNMPMFANVEGNAISQGFVTATLVYCIGAMAIIGSIQEGMTGNAQILYAKAMLDGITAIFFTSSMGIGVAFSSLSVLVYQGVITLLASFLSSFLSEPVINEMTATGGVLIMGISLVMLKLNDIKLANLLPAIIFAIFITFVYTTY